MMPNNMMIKRFSVASNVAWLLAVSIVVGLPARAQVWINTNTASTSGPLPGASPVALQANASMYYLPSIVKAMTNFYAADDWTNSIQKRLGPYSAWRATTDTNENSTFDIGSASYKGTLGLFDLAEAQFLRTYPLDGYIYVQWDGYPARPLWSFDDPFTNTPIWEGVVNEAEAERIASLAEGLSGGTNIALGAASNWYDAVSRTIYTTNQAGGGGAESDPLWAAQSNAVVRTNDSRYLAALTNAEAFATASQGSKADTALQDASTWWQYIAGGDVDMDGYALTGAANLVETNNARFLAAWTNLTFSGSGNAITNATASGDTFTLQRGTISGGTGATQLIANVAGAAARTSTIAGAVLTLTDLPAPAGGGSSGVSSLNSATGALQIVAGSNITVQTAGSNITINANASGGGSSTSVPPWLAAATLANAATVTVDFAATASPVDYLAPTSTTAMAATLPAGPGIGRKVLVFAPVATNVSVSWPTNTWAGTTYFSLSSTTNTILSASVVATPLGTNRIELMKWSVMP